MSICTYHRNPSWRARVRSVPSIHFFCAPTKIVHPSEVADLLAQRDALSRHVVMHGHGHGHGHGRPTIFYGGARVFGPYFPTRLAQCVPSWHKVGTWVLWPLICQQLLWNLSSRMFCVVCAVCALPSMAFCPADSVGFAPVLLPNVECAPRHVFAPLLLYLQRVVGRPPVNSYPVGRRFDTPPALCLLCSR